MEKDIRVSFSAITFKKLPNKHEKPPNKHFVNGALIDII